MNTGEFQEQLFQLIKRRLPADASTADEVATLLEISTDSAYRRMRGEKTMTIDELYKLATNYHLSVDQLMGIQTDAISFQGQFVNRNNFHFEHYINSIIQNVAYINSCENKEFYYICKDLPIFHHYHFRELAAFKWFFWHKSYLQYPDFEQKKFSFSQYPDSLYSLEQKALEIYNQIPSIEIWNIENMNVIFRQIDFYRNAEVFNSDEDIFKLYDAIEKTWDHLEEQAAIGYKFKYGDPAKEPIGEYKMYFNEVLLGDNSLFAVLDGLKICYLTHSTINYIMTRDVTFTENMYRHIQNQLKRSTLISEVSEKERSRFFRIIRERLQKRKEALVL